MLVTPRLGTLWTGIALLRKPRRAKGPHAMQFKREREAGALPQHTTGLPALFVALGLVTPTLRTA